MISQPNENIYTKLYKRKILQKWTEPNKNLEKIKFVCCAHPSLRFYPTHAFLELSSFIFLKKLQTFLEAFTTFMFFFNISICNEYLMKMVIFLSKVTEIARYNKYRCASTSF